MVWAECSLTDVKEHSSGQSHLPIRIAKSMRTSMQLKLTRIMYKLVNATCFARACLSYNNHLYEVI